MIQLQRKFNLDILGAVASGVCLLHCIATPFIFVAKACSLSCCADAPVWWQAVDYFFIIISFITIYHATKTTTKPWVTIALWISWGVLLSTILGETFKLGLFPNSFIYLPALVIVGLHFYNLKYCQCAGDTCCATSLLSS